MEFTIEQAPFAEALRQTKHGLSAQDYPSTAPYVLLQVEGGRVTLVTFGGQLRVAVALTASVAVLQEGTYAAHHEQLLAAVKPLSGRLRVRLDEQGLLVRGEGDLQRQTPVAGKEPGTLPAFLLLAEEGATYTRKQSRTITCPTCGAHSYPSVTEVYRIVDVAIQSARLGRERLAHLLQQVQWAAADDDSASQRPALACIALELVEGRFALMAGDGNCSAVAQEWLGGSAETWQRIALAPPAAFAKAVKLLPRGTQVLVEACFTTHQLVKEGDAAVEDGPIAQRPTLLRFSAGALSVTIPLRDATPPNYRAVIPGSCTVRAVCDRADLLRAVEAVLGVAQEEDNTIWLHLGATLKVEAKRAEQRIAAVHEVSLAERTGPDLHLRLNLWYLLDQLRALSQRQVVLELPDPQGSTTADLLLRPCSDREHYLCVVRVHHDPQASGAGEEGN